MWRFGEIESLWNRPFLIPLVLTLSFQFDAKPRKDKIFARQPTGMIVGDHPAISHLLKCAHAGVGDNLTLSSNGFS